MAHFQTEKTLLREETVPPTIWFALLKEDIERDLATARRTVLLSIIWRESYLTCEGLTFGAEAVLGKGCFGKSVADTFCRDIRVLRNLLLVSGHKLKFSRRGEQTGYYIEGRPLLAPELAEPIRASIAEVDLRQIAISRRLSPAHCVQKAGRLSDDLHRMAVRRLRSERPELSHAEAHREVLKRNYALKR